MYIVKLTFNYDFPIMRQTPNNAGVWGNYKFVIDDTLTECDYWIIYNEHKLTTETVKCNPNNIIFIPAECYNTSAVYTANFLNQFATILTVQREIKHKNVLHTHNANPWFIGKNYDELTTNVAPTKTKLLSVVSSNKAFTAGHVKRLEFVQQLKAHFGDRLDVYGRGINDFDDKWDVVAPYKYSIAIENDNCDDWVTEKFFDCLYANTFTFYYGCPNLEKYVDKRSFKRINIDNFEESVATIEAIINDETHYQNVTHSLQTIKLNSLDADNFFPWVVSYLQTMNTNLPKQLVTIQSPQILQHIHNSKISVRIINKLKRIFTS
ncbi:MAG: glycosyltransferase family 10 [Bacteroidia bacterium]